MTTIFNLHTLGSNWIFNPEYFDFLYGGATYEEQLVLLPAKVRKAQAQNQFTVLEDQYNSVFYKTYILPSLQDNSPIHDVATTIGKMFQRLFRVPFCVFKEICSGIRGHHVIPKHGYGAKGSETVKLPLLVLGALRILGSGCTFDAQEELTGVSRDTHRKFFHDIFCTWGQHVAKDIITMPDDENSVCHVMALYERQGLPGCVGSVDCVHVCWDQCPASMHSTCKGKDKYPTTLAFEVTCSHTRKILHVSQFFGEPTMTKQYHRWILCFNVYAMMMPFYRI
jgi:Plant transposon protein.